MSVMHLPTRPEPAGRWPAVDFDGQFPGRDHFTCGGDGWEAVADYAFAWVTAHASVDAMV